MRREITFFTDTATICLFDPACLRHRLNDAADWWTVPIEAVKEINEGNALFVDVGSDGQYTLDIHDGPLTENEACVNGIIKCPSGRLFVGPAEETPGEGCEASSRFGGEFLDLEPGIYGIDLAEQGGFTVQVVVNKKIELTTRQNQDILRLFT